MRTASKKLILSLASALYILMSGAPLYADDIEIFTGINANAITANPNVLFIIDTSGSMNSSVTVTTGVYDPATTYAGTCDSSRYYWSQTGTAPACGSTYYIQAASFYCNDASTALSAGGTGYYTGRFARYRNLSTDQWRTLYHHDVTSRVECEADYGIDGDGVDTTKLYPANQNNNGPWRSNSSNAISWASTGGSYTFYSANYINWLNSPGVSTTMSRLAIVKDVLKKIIDSTSGINAALMRFDNKSYSSNVGGYFVEPMQEINAATRPTFKSTIDALSAGGWTPLAETLYEAMLYYQGKPVYFGDGTSPGTNVAGVLKPSNTSEYKSPIEFQCQKNFAVVLTDGAPTYDDSADALINGLTGFSTLTGGCGYSADDCLDEVAHYMYDTDQSNLNGIQNVITYTIGFATNQQLLLDTARKGGSSGGNVDPSVGYFTADSVTGLTNAFTSIMTEINRINTTFISPAVSVNAFNRLTHRSELYFALFLPTEKYRWPGNLKKYKLARAITGDPNSELIIVDANTPPLSAVDTATGFFKSSARSFWSNAVDGADVKLGGAAEKLPTTNRRVYTFTGVDSSLVPPQTNTETLNTNTNRLHEDNDASTAGGTLTNALLGLSATTTDADRIALIQWARGVDVLDEDSDGSTTDYRQSMGDPLHSEPQLVNYKGTTDADADITLYMTTNEGYLHAINASDGNPATVDGNELFAFMPKELLPNLNILKGNTTTATRTYGLDGPMTIWHKDLNNDLLVLNPDDTVQSSSGEQEHVYLYFGMRRGGNNYYALDVTNRNSPKLKWKIEGGVPGDFEELGQSWSKMSYAKIEYAGAEKDVLIFGGGYDTSVDNATLPADDSTGRAIFIVDAETGKRLWWASASNTGADLEFAEMKNSIAANLTAFDSTGDGYVDRIYAADTAARIWRFDLKDSTAGMVATGGVFADLNGTAVAAGTAANNRHFYYAPDVSYVRQGSQEYFTIAIGSGFRAHPLDTSIEDRFYVLRDPNVRGPAVDSNGNAVYTTITENDLYDTTGNIIGEGNQTQIDAARQSLNTNQGWYIKLNETDGSFIGEKVIGESITFNGILIFSSFTPTSTQANTCSAKGASAAWAINLIDGQPVFNFDTSNPDLTRSDRKGALSLQGLPPSPSIVFTEDGDITAFFGTLQLKDAGDGMGNKKLKPNNFYEIDYWNIR